MFITSEFKEPDPNCTRMGPVSPVEKGVLHFFRKIRDYHSPHLSYIPVTEKGLYHPLFFLFFFFFFFPPDMAFALLNGLTSGGALCFFWHCCLPQELLKLKKKKKRPFLRRLWTTFDLGPNVWQAQQRYYPCEEIAIVLFPYCDGDGFLK